MPIFRRSKIPAALACAVLWLAPVPARAQWIHYKTPGIPRTADGKPNLAAPTPHAADGKPDLTGLWREDQSATGPAEKAIAGLKAQPWAEALSKKRVEDLGKEDMGVLCQPAGPRAGSLPRKIVQTPGLLVILNDDLTYRQVYMDGRALEDDPNPSWLGYSVGHWEGDTLVAETVGFAEVSRGLNFPYSDQMKIVERFHLTDPDTMTIETTIVDPKALTMPYSMGSRTLKRHRNWTIAEYVCEENNRNFVDGQGKAGINLAHPEASPK